MIRREPAVDDLDYLQYAIAESQPERRLLATVACVALDGKGKHFSARAVSGPDRAIRDPVHGAALPDTFPCGQVR